jgi:hypothetical protein
MSDKPLKSCEHCAWIDTSSKLPPIGEPVLFVDSDGEVKYGRRGIYTDDDFECESEMSRDGEYEIYKKHSVTKWMFVPKP